MAYRLADRRQPVDPAPHPFDHPPVRGVALIVLALTVIAMALRMYHLGRWTFEGDEIFTLRDSLTMRWGNPRPLLYALNHYVVLPFTPLDEFGLRLLPAIFGALTIPAFYVMGRRLIGSRAALFGALLLTINNVHIYHSQYARYWSLVFLFSAIYPFAIYLGIRDADRRMLAIGVLTAVLAVLAHPVSVILVGGLAVWLGTTYLRREVLADLWKQPSGRWGIGAAATIMVIVLARYLPILQGWMARHDPSRPGRGGEHLLHMPRGLGIKQVGLVLSYVEGLTLPLVLIAATGIYLLWRQGNRQVAMLLIYVAIVPITFLVLLSTRTAVSTSYLLPAAPVFFFGAGVFLDWFAGANQGVRPRWLLPALVLALVILPGMPTLISQYRDGRRHDFRGAAQWLAGHATSEDLVYSDQYQVLEHYLPDTQVERLRADPELLADSMRSLERMGRTLWIVMPAPSHSFRTNPKLGALMQWVYGTCQLRNTVGVGRIDFRQNYLQIYRCPATTGTEVGTKPE